MANRPIPLLFRILFGKEGNPDDFAEVKRRLGFDPAKVNACAMKKPHRKTAYGYVWKYKDAVSSNSVEEK